MVVCVTHPCASWYSERIPDSSINASRMVCLQCEEDIRLKKLMKEAFREVLKEND